jgi:hypothetical protein
LAATAVPDGDTTICTKLNKPKMANNTTSKRKKWFNFFMIKNISSKIYKVKKLLLGPVSDRARWWRGQRLATTRRVRPG